MLSIAGTREMREFIIYWIALALAVAVLAAIVLLLRSRYGLALTAIRDNELGARSNGVDVARVKYLVYVAVAFGTAMVGALIFLQKIRISPDTAFSVNDWTAFVIFITVIGGIGRIEGPIVGTVVFFLLRQTLADLGAIYLLILGAVAIVVMLKAPKGLWGLIADRYGWQLFPLERRLVIGDNNDAHAAQGERPWPAAIRRVVTGHDENGRAIVVSDGPAPFVHLNPLLPGWQSTDIWRTDGAPASIPATPGETTLGPRRQLPTKNATVLRINHFPPETEADPQHERRGIAPRLRGARQRTGGDLRQGRPPSAHAPHRDHRLRDRAVGRDHHAARRRGRGAEGRRHPGPVRHQPRLEQPLECTGGGGVHPDRRRVRAGAEGEVRRLAASASYLA